MGERHRILCKNIQVNIEVPATQRKPIILQKDQMGHPLTLWVVPLSQKPPLMIAGQLNANLKSLDKSMIPTKSLRMVELKENYNNHRSQLHEQWKTSF